MFDYWDGTCWPALEDPILRSELYKFFEAKQYADGDKLKPFAPTTRKVADLMDAARAITIIETTMPTPAWLDPADHPADEIIACANGLVHWPTRTMSEHRPGFYVHHSVPFSLDSKAPPPKRWLAFLAELWGDDTETIDALQEMAGYLVSGDTRQQKMFLLVGPKRGGKGTIARVLTRIGPAQAAGRQAAPSKIPTPTKPTTPPMINSSPAGIRTQRYNGLLSQRKKPPTPLGSPADSRGSAKPDTRLQLSRAMTTA